MYVCTKVHTCMHAHNTHTHTHTHTLTNTHSHTHTHTTHTHMHTYTHTHMHTYTHKHTCTHSPTHTDITSRDKNCFHKTVWSQNRTTATPRKVQYVCTYVSAIVKSWATWTEWVMKPNRKLYGCTNQYCWPYSFHRVTRRHCAAITCVHQVYNGTVDWLK